MYSLSYSRAALKALRRMPTNTAQLIHGKLRELAVDPTRMRNIKKLAASPGYRLRVGDWRIIYTLNQERLAVEVIKIETRGGVYK
jgi:mRNA interferase RelE/StbE